MSQADLTSVIIPCYNQARFLGDAIRSVLAQTHSSHEVIVVDDGSTDDTAAVAARFGRVRCLRQKNCGLAAARNAGLKAASGRFVIFLDADDKLLPNAIEDGLAALIANPMCGFVYGHVKLIAADGSALPTPEQISVHADHYVELMSHNYIWTTGTVVYRRTALDAVGGFNARLTGSADFDLNARMASRFPVCCCETEVLEYRRHDEAMSRDYSLMLESAVTARRLQWNSVRGCARSEQALKAGIRRAQEDYGEKLIGQVGDQIRARRWREAANGLVTLLRYYPQGLVTRARKKFARSTLIAAR